MQIQKIEQDFSVCKLRNISGIDLSGEFCFIGKTDEEISLVCPTENVPAGTLEREDGWKAFRLKGILDFSLVGILSKISGLLAENGISIFALSTFNTDYVLTKAEDYTRALGLLEKGGYSVF